MAEQNKSTNSLAATCRVFISYSHDSLEHQQRVLALANQLRRNGVEAWIDQYIQDPNEGWIRWMRSQVRQASRVLLVFTETYQRRFEGDEEEGKGLGATFEGVIVTQALYESGGRNAKFRPVVFSEQEETFIPEELRHFNRYRVDTQDNYQNLLRWLYEAPRIVVPSVGDRPDLPPESAPELFSSKSSETTARNPTDTVENPDTPTEQIWRAELISADRRRQTLRVDLSHGSHVVEWKDSSFGLVQVTVDDVVVFTRRYPKLTEIHFDIIDGTKRHSALFTITLDLKLQLIVDGKLLCTGGQLH